MTPELSRIAAAALQTMTDLEARRRLVAIVEQANSVADLPPDIQVLLKETADKMTAAGAGALIRGVF